MISATFLPALFYITAPVQWLPILDIVFHSAVRFVKNSEVLTHHHTQFLTLVPVQSLVVVIL